MGFGEAVKTGLVKYATFTGRARRSEYWWFFLFLVLVNYAGRAVDFAVGNEFPIVNTLVTTALFLPFLASTVRRLHDTGRSAWWLPLALIPLLGLIWLCKDSQRRDNQYGLSPKGYDPPKSAPAY